MVRSLRIWCQLVLVLWVGCVGAVCAQSVQTAKGAVLPTVAVWDFDNHTVPAFTTLASLDFLARTLSESMLAALVGVPGLRVVDRMRLHDILTEQKLGASALADADTRLRLGRLTGAQRMVFGSFTAVGNQVQLTLRVVDVATSQVTHADECTADFAAVPAEAQLMSTRLAQAMGGRARAQPKPQTTDAWARYDSALALVDAGQYEQALQALQNILATHKDFAPAERQIVVVLEKLARQ